MKIIITPLLTFLSLQVISQNPCNNSTVIMTQNIIDSTQSSTKSNLSIIASNQINHAVSYYSKNTIELNSGFNTAEKATFKASIENCSQNVANNTWYKIANFPGVPRVNGVAFNIGNKGYFGCGGVTNGGPYLQDFWEYDIQNNIWSRKVDVPVSFSSSYGFSINGKGYVMNGFGTNLSIYEYNPTNDTWTIKLNQIPALGRSTNFVWNNSAYIVPGIGENPSVYKFDPAANTFTPFAALPTIYDFTKVGSSKVSFVIDNKVYIGMGVNLGNFSEGVKTFHTLDLLTQTWTRISDFPFTYGLIGSSGFGINGKGIVIGGGIQQQGNKTFSVFYEYNPSTDTWLRKLDFAGGGVFAGRGFIYNNTIFLGFGGDITNEGNKTDFWFFKP